jgi:Mg/Co/Ni transporter MgtE
MSVQIFEVIKLAFGMGLYIGGMCFFINWGVAAVLKMIKQT